MKPRKNRRHNLGAISYGWQGEMGGGIDSDEKVYNALDRVPGYDAERKLEEALTDIDQQGVRRTARILENDPLYQQYLDYKKAQAAKRKAWIIGGISAVVVIGVGAFVIAKQKK
jgi:hypothetical protein